MKSRMKAIVEGRVLDGIGEGFIEQGVILIQGKKLLAVGGPQEVTIPEDAEIIPIKNRYVVPGLIDAHNHLFWDKSFEAQSLDPPGEILLRCLRNARKQLRDGVTTLRDCGTPKFTSLLVKRAINEGLAPGPNLVCCGQWVTSSYGHGAFPGAGTIADGSIEAQKAVRMVLREGADFIKVMVSGGNASHWTDPLKAYFGAEELKVIVDEAHSQGKLVAAHIHGGPGVRFAVEAGIDTLEHGSFVTDDAEIDLIASRGVAWMFNQGGRMADANSDLDLLKLYGNQILRSRKTSIVAFQKAKKAGIRIILGADGYHDDHACVLAMEALVKCGATPQEALRAATRTPAEIFGMIHERGTLEAGKFADLLVINANPFENISALRDIQMAIKEGRDYSDLRRENSNS